MDASVDWGVFYQNENTYGSKGRRKSSLSILNKGK